MKTSKIFSATSAALLMTTAMASVNAGLFNKNQTQKPYLTTLKLQTADSGLGHGPDASMRRNNKQHKYMYTHILQTGRSYTDEILVPQPRLNAKAKPDDLTATSKKRQNKINRFKHGSTISGSTQR